MDATESKEWQEIRDTIMDKSYSELQYFYTKINQSISDVSSVGGDAFAEMSARHHLRELDAIKMQIMAEMKVRENEMIDTSALLNIQKDLEIIKEGLLRSGIITERDLPQHNPVSAVGRGGAAVGRGGAAGSTPFTRGRFDGGYGKKRKSSRKSCKK